MKYGLAHFTETHLTSIGLIIFFGFFVGVLWWTARKDSKQLYQKMESLPLEDGEKL